MLFIPSSRCLQIIRMVCKISVNCKQLNTHCGFGVRLTHIFVKNVEI